MLNSEVRYFIFYLLFILFVRVLQGQRSTQNNDCSRIKRSGLEFTCQSIYKCPNINNIVNTPEFKICGYERYNSYNIARVCCPQTIQTSTIGLSTTRLPFRRTTGYVTANAQTNVSTARRYPTKDPIAVVNAMCTKYSEARYRTIIYPPLTPTENETIVKDLDCHIVNSFIVHGLEAKPKEFPHMALIGYVNEINNNIEWDCGGSLISENFVLSAAHCSSSNGRVPQWVRLGDLDYSTDIDDARPINVRIVEHIVHPDYNGFSIYNDIALFRLEKNIKFSPYIRPICLNADPTIIPDKNVLISGWGTTGAGFGKSSTLLKASISLTAYDECRPYYASDTKVPNGVDPQSMICALDETIGRDSCTGDSGGPMQILHPIYRPCVWSQIGIVSIGSGFCGDQRTPAIYTKIANYINWIQKIVWP